MRFTSILPIVAIGLGVTNAVAIDDDNMLDARAPSCPPQGIELIKLKIKKGKFFTGVGKPGQCNDLPSNIKTFDVNSDDTKSLVGCFDCEVYTGEHCTGSSVTLEGQQAFMFKGAEHPTFKSWRCKCKN
ncbi:uncharacterized protein FTOL_13298 [Fusarium torulosum]|uniref:Uncharacterized protein n=1 Tax=Fusarium torulosum TaxID=33205 RepID=A0AAE8MLU3_9HYPO|nr:uncharacterized protein FTOL_13298 [Fusarium torulosum]